MQHLDEDLHLASGQRQEVLEPRQTHFLLVRRTNTSRLDGTPILEAEQLQHVLKLRDIALEDPVAEIPIDSLELNSVQLDDDSRLKKDKKQ